VQDVELSPRSDDESEGAPRRAAAQQFTVPEIWDDVEFRVRPTRPTGPLPPACWRCSRRLPRERAVRVQMRKDRMTENLAAAADKIRVGQVRPGPSSRVWPVGRLRRADA